MSVHSPDVAKIQHAVDNALYRHWQLYLTEGIVLLVLGFAAIVLPSLATFALTILLGWLFLFSGITGLITTIWMHKAPGFVSSLISALLAIGVGCLVLVMPFSGAFSLTILLVVFFIFEGVVSIAFALDHKRELSGRWGLMMASGFVDLVLATMLLAGLPSTAGWAIGILVGINMMFGGAALVGMALHAKNPT
ncbi:MAG: HdeD family acid-resistance protein [Pseudolabrys sp.]